MSLIKLVGVDKSYRTKEIETLALENVNLEVEEREFVSIMGPSGCGKSTLLNLIGLLDKPTKGEVLIDGRKVGELPDAAQAHFRNANIGFVFQSFHLIPTLNVADAGESIQNKDFLRVSPILDYIRDNLAEPLTLDQIAGQFYISKHYLCRIFKAATGFSVMEYIIYSRVLRARQLLQEGCSVQEAGELSGFSDNSHFIRTFGHLTGLTPGRYAKEYQSGEQVLL